MRTRAYVIWAIVVAFAAVGGCKKHSSSETAGLPAARSWHAPPPMASEVGSDPHAGMNMGGNPHAGMNMGGNPHAGMNMGDAGMNMGGNPHAGMNMGGNPHAGMTDVSQSGLSAPNPNRQIDPSKYLRGEISAGPGIAAKIHAGEIMFLSAQPINPSTGNILGPPLAVDRLTINKLPVHFNLTQANMMVAGTVFAGDVLIKAHIDSDGDARTSTPGDIVGTIRAKIPAAGLKLVLNTVVQ